MPNNLLQVIPLTTTDEIAKRDEIAVKINKYGNVFIAICLYLHNNVLRWWRGEICGKRCAKNIVDDFSSFAGVAAGAVAGGAIGSCVGSVGVALGCLCGGIIGAFVTSQLLQMLTEELFDLPKLNSLKEAYDFMGLEKNVSNYEVNKTYKKFALIYHPDKGGSNSLFVKLNACASIIKAARENEF